MLARELELAAMDGNHSDRKVVLRHLEPVLDRDVVGAGGVRGRERPAPGPELDPCEAPERVALRGSSRSRHSWCSRSSKARASTLFEDGARVFTTASVASRTSCSPPMALGKSRARAGRSSDASESPANQPRMAWTARARRRSTSSSSCSASSSAARACSDPPLLRFAHARRQWMIDCSAGLEVASRSAASSSAAPIEASRARRGEQAPRRVPSRFPPRPAGRSRSLGRASTRRQPDAHELQPALDDGARRARPAASAGAPARRARPRRLTHHDRPPVSRRRRAEPRRRRPARPSRARGDAPGRAGPRRSPRSGRERLPAPGPGLGRGPTTAAGG